MAIVVPYVTMPTRSAPPAAGLVFAVVTLCAGHVYAATVLDDPLAGATSGTREGGAFVSGGWKVVGKDDCIYWHIPSISQGAYEYDVRGLNPNECRPGLEDKAELSHMYDHAWGNSDVVYNGGYRENPYKHFVRKTGCLGSYNNTIDSCELLWAISPNYVEPDTPVLSWNPSATYRIRVEWGPDGAGNTYMKWLRDGVPYLTTSLPGTYAPAGHSFRIGASPRRDAYAGAPVDAVFSRVKVFDLASATPAAPAIIEPAAAQVVNTPRVFVKWSGDPHSLYQVQVNTSNQPDRGVIWDSGQVGSDRDFAFSGVLPANATYHVFVRLGAGDSLGPWSAARQFTLDTTHTPAGPNMVVLQGNSVTDHNGPFPGLGVTYMSALYWAKHDRNLLNSDLTYLSSKDFNYIRILSEVPGGCGDYWDGRGIHPVNYTSRGGCFMPAWTDYAAQLQYLLDTVYDVHGMRTEITIFGGAGDSMPLESTRIEHLDRVLAAIAGREHKVLMLEVANEGWQTGFEGSQGRADMREFAQYLAQRTPVLVAITSPQDTSNVGILDLYGGTLADIATVHFSRDVSLEGGWYPVRDCWRTGLTGIPPLSSNEPVGPGSSVASETEPIRLVMAAAFAWGAGLPMYVYHTRAGVRRDVTFQSMAASSDFIHLNDILPADLPSWVRHDGKEPAAPFTTYCKGQPDKYWTEVSSPFDGVVRHTGCAKGGEFITMPIGILAGGVELECRRPMSFSVYNPLAGEVVYNLTKAAGDRVVFPQGPGAYIIRGFLTDIVGPTQEVSIDLGAPDTPRGIAHVSNDDGETVPAGVGGRACRTNLNPADDFYFYFDVSDAFAFHASKPGLYVILEYYDAGTSTLTLEYDAIGDDFSFRYKSGGSVTLTNEYIWKAAVFGLTDANFANRQNAGADFRIGDVGHKFYVDRAWVTTDPPQPPEIAEIVPDPEVVYPQVPYARQLTLIQGTPSPTWSLREPHPAGLGVSASGLVHGWTPAGTEMGDHAIAVEACNPLVCDVETWVVRVASYRDFDTDGDVDQADFGLMQRCLTAHATAAVSGCESTDLDGDRDIDQADLGLFVPCMNGANKQPGC